MYQETEGIRNRFEQKRERVAASLIKYTENVRRHSLKSVTKTPESETMQMKRISRLPSLNRQLHRRLKTQVQPIPHFNQIYTSSEETPLMLELTTLISNPNISALQSVANNMRQQIQIFSKLSKHSVMILLSYSTLTLFYPGNVIYRRGQPSPSFFIILFGEVNLINKSDFFHRKCYKGECLGEQSFFPENQFIKKVIKKEKGGIPRLQTAKAIEKCCLMEIKTKAIALVNDNLRKRQLKTDILLIQKFLWRNFTSKKSQRLDCLV